TDGQDIAGFTGKKPGLLIIGNEAKGIRASLRQRPSVIPVTIPRKGQAESLNAAVATGILLAYLT
ncbi:MAG: TrmH family RNA methyltransferase, partial [Chitinophagaceae bacterium]